VRQYVTEVRRYVECIGNLAFAAPMDWMVEDQVLAKTGLTVQTHQMLTLLNFVELLNADDRLPWIPVLQGRSAGDYFRHAEMYAAAGVDLKRWPLVGVGTMCRRSAETLPNAVLHALARVDGLRLHAFGYKLRGLALSKDDLVSSDSLGWSYHARRTPPLPECAGTHERCNNCLRFALQWRTKVLRLLGKEEPPERPAEGPRQGELF
jgi:hypothetical protein